MLDALSTIEDISDSVGKEQRCQDTGPWHLESETQLSLLRMTVAEHLFDSFWFDLEGLLTRRVALSQVVLDPA